MPSAISDLPNASSPDIHLTQPTDEERRATWILNSAAWQGALNTEQYLGREAYMENVPLAKDGGITYWILVDKNLPPNERPILGSCETLRKRAFVSKDGAVTDSNCYSIGSVFCNPEYRGRRYASRMMKDLGQELKSWQAGKKPAAFSALWSDIGKEYYSILKWYAFPSLHVEFPPVPLGDKITPAIGLRSTHLKELCEVDEGLIRHRLAGINNGKTQVAIIPEFDQMQWHHLREDFLCSKISGKVPVSRGALIGEKGNRMWAVWTRTLYGPIDKESGNTMHILRLAIENEPSPNSSLSKTRGLQYEDDVLEQRAEQLKAILRMAQAEAAEWNLKHVELWNPTPFVKLLIQKTELTHKYTDRQKESIPSLMWYGEGSGDVDEIEWVGNEKYGWF